MRGRAATRGRGRAEPPILSVVIPAYDAAEHIEPALRSILSQSLRSLEVIVVDDGSRDDTLEIARKVADRDSRVRVLAGPNQGPGAARNRGIAAATGRYLTFVDADDHVLPHAYRDLVGSLERSGSDVAVGGYLRVGRAGRSRPNVVEKVHATTRTHVRLEEAPELLAEPVLWNKVVRRDHWDTHVETVPLDVNYEDQEPAYRMLLAAQGIDVLERDVYAWRLSDGRRTRSSTKGRLATLRARAAVIERLESLLSEAPEAVRATAYACWIGTDLAMHAEFVPLTRKKYWRDLRRVASSLADRAPRGAWDRMPIQGRLLGWVLAHGQLDDVEEILGTRLEETTALPWERADVGLGWQARPTFLPRLGVSVPEELLRMTSADREVVAAARSLEWQGPSELTITGYAYLRGPDPAGCRVRLVARSGSVDLTVVETRPALDARIDLESGDPWRSYREAGFVARLQLPDIDREESVTLLVELVAPDGWRVRHPLTVASARGVVGPAPVVLREAGARRWVVRTNARDRVVLRRRRTSRPALVATRVSCTGHAVVIDALADDDAPGELILSAHGEEVTLGRLPSVPGVRRFSGVLPALRECNERRWEVLAECDSRGELRRVPAAAGLDGQPGAGRVRGLAGADGSLIVVQRKRHGSVDGAAVEGDRLVLHGRLDPVPATPRIVLRSSVACHLPEDLTVSEDGTYRAAWSLTVPGSEGAPVGRLAGGCFVRFGEGDGGSDEGASGEEWARVGGRLAESPVDLRTRWASLRVEGRRDGAVAVMASPPLTAVETSRAGQFALRRAEWGALRPLVVLESFNGEQTAGNARAIYEAMRSLDPALEYVWSIRDARVPVPPGARSAVVGSADWHRALATARVWVNDNNFPFYVTKRPGQYFLQTWHGTPIKRLLHDLPRRRAPLTYRRLMARQVPQWDLLLADSHAAARHLRSGLGYAGEVRVMVAPRNVRLLAGEEGRRHTREALGLGEDERVVLYAPTWREAQRASKTMRWAELLDVQRLGDELDATVLVRSHHVAASVGVVGSRVRDVTYHPHIEDLMLASDVLVTDYSSAAFDYRLTGRPVVHYVPDLERYRRERGFYGDWPGPGDEPVVQDTRSLTAELGRVLDRPRADSVLIWQNQARQALADLASDLVMRAFAGEARGVSERSAGQREKRGIRRT